MSNRKHIQMQKMKRPTPLVGFLECQFIETTVRGQTCRSTRTHYSDSPPTSLCSFSLMLRAQRRSNKYQFYSLWFDPTGTRTHDLPHSRLVTLRLSLNYRSLLFLHLKECKFRHTSTMYTNSNQYSRKFVKLKHYIFLMYFYFVVVLT